MTNLAQAIAERDTGMRDALSHAESVMPTWGDVALLYLQAYARAHREFIAEDVVEYAASRGLNTAQPKAWGAVFQNAARRADITRRGYAPSRKRHLSPTVLWASQIYREPQC